MLVIKKLIKNSNLLKNENFFSMVFLVNEVVAEPGNCSIFLIGVETDSASLVFIKQLIKLFPPLAV